MVPGRGSPTGERAVSFWRGRRSAAAKRTSKRRRFYWTGWPAGGSTARRAAGFAGGTAIPAATGVRATGPQIQQTWRHLGRALARCRTAPIAIAGKKARATIRPLSFPHVAGVSSAYAWAFTTAGIRIGLDLVLFQSGRYAGYLAYSDLGPPAITTVTAFAGAAAENMALEAVELGLGVSFVRSATEEAVKRALDIPERYRVDVVVGVGYKSRNRPPPMKAQRPTLHHNRFGEKWNGSA